MVRASRELRIDDGHLLLGGTVGGKRVDSVISNVGHSVWGWSSARPRPQDTPRERLRRSVGGANAAVSYSLCVSAVSGALAVRRAYRRVVGGCAGRRYNRLEAIAGVETFAEQARRRAETEREAVEWAIDDYYGILTVDTCGTISMYKGVNDQGLVAANTYIECEREDVSPERQLRNGEFDPAP